jgi:hypothetical protein
MQFALGTNYSEFVPSKAQSNLKIILRYLETARVMLLKEGHYRFKCGCK